MKLVQQPLDSSSRPVLVMTDRHRRTLFRLCDELPVSSFVDSRRRLFVMDAISKGSPDNFEWDRALPIENTEEAMKRFNLEPIQVGMSDEALVALVRLVRGILDAEKHGIVGQAARSLLELSYSAAELLGSRLPKDLRDPDDL